MHDFCIDSQRRTIACYKSSYFHVSYNAEYKIVMGNCMVLFGKRVA